MKNLMVVLLTVALSTVAQAGEHKAVKDKIHELVTAFNIAYATNEVDAYFDFYTEDATLYFFGERWTVEGYSKYWHEMIAAGGGVEKNETSDVRIQVLAGGKAAVSTAFVDNQARSPEGEITTARAFETDVWEKTDEGWKIVSLHYSEISEE